MIFETIDTQVIDHARPTPYLLNSGEVELRCGDHWSCLGCWNAVTSSITLIDSVKEYSQGA